jgi:hypothetical protein
VALVSGAAQGIGQALALALAERGAEVIVTDLSLPRETVNEIGPTGHAFELDVTQEEDWRSLSLNPDSEVASRGSHSPDGVNPLTICLFSANSLRILRALCALYDPTLWWIE